MQQGKDVYKRQLQNDTLTLYKIKTVFYHKCSMIYFKLICQKNNKTTKKTEYYSLYRVIY